MMKQCLVGFSEIRILYQASKERGVLAEAGGKIAQLACEVLEDNRDA